MEGYLVSTKFKYNLLCRVCLSKGEDMQALFEEDSIIQRIEYCTGLHLSPEPNLPSHICRTCLEHLDTAHTFKTTCLTSDNSLRSTLPHEDSYLDALAHSPQRHGIIVKEEDVNTDSDGLDSLDWGDEDEDRRNKRVKMKREPEDTKDGQPDMKSAPKKRGPYKKTGRPRKKYKFRDLSCKICKIKFSSKKESNAHNAATHVEYKEPEQWICEFCGKVFARRTAHSAHVLGHGAPAHRCPHCQYRTKYRSDLNKHLLIHTGVKQHQCSMCPRSFHTSSNLIAHVRRLHERLKPYSCPQCHKRYFCGTKLRLHLDTHSNVKRYECSLCPSGYTRRCYWKKHLLTQHGLAVPPQRPGPRRHLVGENDMDIKGTGTQEKED